MSNLQPKYTAVSSCAHSNKRAIVESAQALGYSELKDMQTEAISKQIQ